MDTDHAPARVPIRQLVLYFLRLGLLGFGGPVALVGQMERELVADRKWVTRDEMREGIAVCQSLPGPLAIQVGIWLSYRMFMRGDTNPERVASRLPQGFKPEWSWRRGDTYVGYEREGDRLAIVDYPHAAIVNPRDVRSFEPMDESIAWIVHRWVVVYVANPPGKLRVWFGLSAGERDAMLTRLKSLRA